VCVQGASKSYPDQRFTDTRILQYALEDAAPFKRLVVPALLVGRDVCVCP